MKLSDFKQKYMVDLSQLGAGDKFAAIMGRIHAQQGQKGDQDLTSPQAARKVAKMERYGQAKGLQPFTVTIRGEVELTTKLYAKGKSEAYGNAENALKRACPGAIIRKMKVYKVV